MPTRVQLPDGSVGEFPDGMTPEQIQGVLAKQFPPPSPPQPMLSRAFDTAKDIGAGILKGAGSTANNIGHMLYPDALAKHLTGAPSAEQQEGYFKPTNTAQSIGKGAEQIGEFFVPGGLEEAGAEKLASLAPKIGKAIPRAITAAASSGLVNKAQGGDFTTGAAAGAGGSLVGSGLKAIAPHVAESALGIRKVDRAFGKTPGEAILNETTGFSPNSVAESAQGKLNELNPQLNLAAKAAGARGKTADLGPALDVLDAAKAKAITQNARTTAAQVDPMVKTLTERTGKGTMVPGPVKNVGFAQAPVQGAPTYVPAKIPRITTPEDMLNLKRGFNEEHVDSWNPEITGATLNTARNAAGSLARAFHEAVPEAAPLDQRISSLIPVAKRAESAGLNAPVGQRVLHRFAAHTGALTLGALGAGEGYRENGLPGAIAGGVLGVAAPEMIASPTGQMAIARTLNSGVSKAVPKVFTSSGLQLDRPSGKDKKKDGRGDD